MNRVLIFAFSLLLLEVILMGGCKSRENNIVQKIADLDSGAAIALSDCNDNEDLNGIAVIENINGIINSDGVGIRENPFLDAALVNRFEKGVFATVLGRSRDRMFLDGYDSFWLRVKIDGAEGWAYGAYVNLLASQYENLPVLSDTSQKYSIDLNWSRDLPEQELIQKEREAIILQSDRFFDVSIQEFYNAIVNEFNQQRSLRPFFLNTQEVGLKETSNYFNLSSSSLSDFIQSSYIDKINISPLIKISDTSASFVINGFRKIPTFTEIEIKAISVNIKKIDNTSFIPLNGKTVVNSISISPYSAEDFVERSWGDVEYFNSFMTTGANHSRFSRLLQMILGD